MPDAKGACAPTPEQPCGCPNRDGHPEPHVDPDLGIEHGERDALNDDPLPHDVPGTSWWNGLYTELPDKFCLCGHPNYLSCAAWPEGGVMGLMLEARDV